MSGLSKWRQRRVVGTAIVAVVAALFGGAAWLNRAREFSPRPASPVGQLLPRPAALAPGLYILGKCAPAAVYLVETAQGLVLVDSGLEPDAAAVIGQVRELGFDIKQLRAVLLTHVHADHSQGAAHLRRLTGAKICAGRGDAEPLRKGEPREAFLATYYMPRLVLHATPVDVEIDNRQTLDFGDTQFVALPCPGHTTGSVCYLMERKRLRALFVGDVIQHLGPGAQGDLGTYAAYQPPLYRGDARAYLASLRQLRNLATPDLVLPGHPRMDTVPQSPRLGELRWHALLDRALHEMEQLLAHYEADGADFLDGTPRELLAGLCYLGELRGLAVYSLESPRGTFLVGAPGDDALLDFVARRSKALRRTPRHITGVLLTSTAKDAVGGLPALLAGTGCVVVAPTDDVDSVRRLAGSSARVIAAAALPQAGWFDVQPIPLKGDKTSMAYRLPWAGKTILFTARCPAHPQSREAACLKSPGLSAADYMDWLDRLAQVPPDLWLPAVATNGQNANLYGNDWKTILEVNKRLAAALP